MQSKSSLESLPTLRTAPGLIPRKVFVRPFRLVFKKSETQDITWIEVETLDGLRQVVKDLGEGKLVPIDGMNTLDRQLWGHLAEHVGFLRYEVDGGEFGEGLQPIGGPQSLLIEDFKDLAGGVDGALSVINNMRAQLQRERESREPLSVENVDHTYVKEDFVNLTDEGEEALAKIVGIDRSSELTATLVSETEPEAAEDASPAPDQPQQDDQETTD